MFAKSVLISALFVALGFASPMELAERQTSCPNIHVFGARETTAPAGYGSAGTVVNLILNAHPGATSEAISYPACGGQSTCGGVSYANSAVQGVSAVASAVNSFNTRCPNTQLVLVGYSQVGLERLTEETQSANELYREAKLWMMPSAVAAIPMRVLAARRSRFKPLLLTRSRRQYSWAIHAIFMACHTKLVLAELKE